MFRDKAEEIKKKKKRQKRKEKKRKKERKKEKDANAESFSAVKLFLNSMSCLGFFNGRGVASPCTQKERQEERGRKKANKREYVSE